MQYTFLQQGYEEGYRFWAPNATEVSLIGDFNGWELGKHPMEKIEDSGAWSIYMPGMKQVVSISTLLLTNQEKLS